MEDTGIVTDDESYVEGGKDTRFKYFPTKETFDQYTINWFKNCIGFLKLAADANSEQEKDKFYRAHDRNLEEFNRDRKYHMLRVDGVYKRLNTTHKYLDTLKHVAEQEFLTENPQYKFEYV